MHDAFWERPEDRFKVWPTNRDRPAFNSVMAANPPMDYDALEHGSSRLVQAHEFFAGAGSQVARDRRGERSGSGWRNRAGCPRTHASGSDRLAAEENAQEIFETLNARGAQLTAADLIKNFIFQRLIETGGQRRSGIRAVLEGVRVRVLGD